MENEPYKIMVIRLDDWLKEIILTNIYFIKKICLIINLNYDYYLYFNEIIRVGKAHQKLTMRELFLQPMIKFDTYVLQKDNPSKVQFVDIVIAY